MQRHSNGKDNLETHRAEFGMRVKQIGLLHIVNMLLDTASIVDIACIARVAGNTRPARFFSSFSIVPA